MEYLPRKIEKDKKAKLVFEREFQPLSLQNIEKYLK